MDKNKEQRKQGRRVSARWFKKTAKKIAREQNIEGFQASKGWFFLFLGRYNLVLRKKTNSKKCSVEQKKPVIAAFHRNLRIFLSTGKNPHPKWGRFLPKNRINVDQVPLPFSCQPAETYEEKGTDRVWIKQNQPGLEKRFCSLQLAFRPGPKQPKPTCIFRGQGKRITVIEKASWDTRVHVMFQQKAWADGVQQQLVRSGDVT